MGGPTSDLLNQTDVVIKLCFTNPLGADAENLCSQQC